jgi:hypothetical protein
MKCNIKILKSFPKYKSKKISHLIQLNKIIASSIFTIFLFLSINAQTNPVVNKMNKSSIIGFKSFKPNSFLKDGSWNKIGVTKDGVYKIDYNFLNESVKINPSTVRFDQFGIFGQAMGILPEFNGDPRTDDIVEIPIKIIDNNNNNIWDNTDYILFYAKGPHTWSYDQVADKFSHTFNIYTEVASYFISTDRGSGYETPLETSPSTSSTTITDFDERVFFEEDINNLIYTELSGGAGSGRNWYGTKLNNLNPSQEISFTIPDLISAESIKIEASFAGGPVTSNTNFTVKNNGSSLFTKFVNAGIGGSYPPMASLGTYNGLLNIPNGNIKLEITFSSSNAQASGWLDFIEITAKRQLKLNGAYTSFRSTQSLSNSISKFSLSNSNSNTEIWDITTPSEIKRVQASLTGSNLVFTRESTTLKEFVAVNVNGSGFEIPTFIEKVSNQNLHHLASVDYIIITTPDFKAPAEKLANFHRTNSGLTVSVVMLNEIYNEFSSGQQDLTAMRDFLKMFYDKNLAEDEKLKYVLLLGDGSFDFKDRITDNQNIIPTFESYSSLTTTASFCTDDYIGFLDDDEGLDMSSNTDANLDLAIGRIPVNTEESAYDVIDKIIYYKTNKSKNAWKNEITFVVDDEDGNLHFRDAEEVINTAAIENKDYYNFDKIYLDAYNQENAAGGDRYPDVVDGILRKLFTGTFFVDYTGHGGPTNWAQERVFNIQDIRNLENKDKLPLFMTATCDFSPFDDPTIVSAGESLLLNPNGGAIAMLSTTRLVYSNSNKQMNKAVMNYLFQKVNGRMPTTGEILQQAKNEASSNANNRKFVLLGDPALTLEYPKYEVVTTKINDNSILNTDTLRALSKVSFEGGIMNDDGSLITDFNGIVFAKVFDKEATYTTKGNDGDNPEDYKLRNNVIFQGKSSVINGKFKFEFIVPKDINYSFGNGKITYYAEQTNNSTIDAHGYNYNFIVGGTEPNIVPDDKGPIVEVYMNDSSFAFGGLTDENPVLLVRLKDESGINTIGNGVGHDIVAVLDENTQNQYLLNDFYEAALDDFTQGDVSYLLNNMADGLHQIKVKAWDVHNNPGEGYTEFIVASSADLSLKHVLNYPNPFTSKTSFIFEHNHPGDNLDVSIQIYTVSGKIVKTIRQQVQSEGFRIDPDQITWNGQDDYGDNIGRGVYLYKVNVRTSSGYNAYKFEKLVILK